MYGSVANGLFEADHKSDLDLSLMVMTDAVSVQTQLMSISHLDILKAIRKHLVKSEMISGEIEPPHSMSAGYLLQFEIEGSYKQYGSTKTYSV